MTKDEREQLRLKQMVLFEEEKYAEGYRTIAGLDEAGRGPLAGPVVAAACILPRGLLIPGVDDSKKLTPRERERLYQCLTRDSRIQYAVGIIDSKEIDRINIYQATIQAMLQAIERLDVIPDCLLVDGLKLPHPFLTCHKIIKGDQLSHSIAAASILAKVTRDKLMGEFHQQWPMYGFDQHKGYATEMHLRNLEKFGPCPIHRFSFDPIKSNALVTSC